MGVLAYLCVARVGGQTLPRVDKKWLWEEYPEFSPNREDEKELYLQCAEPAVFKSGLPAFDI